MEENFYTVNKGKLNHSFANAIDKTSAFKKLVKRLDNCVDECVCNFYSLILSNIKSLEESSAKSQELIPSLFIQGHCVNWDLIFENINEKCKQKIILSCITSSNNSLKKLIADSRRAENENKVLIVFVLQVECFPRNAFINNVIEVLINGQFASCFVVNTTLNFSVILDRINRLNYTFLDVQTQKLDAPADLVNDIYDRLLNGSVIGEVQFSSEILAQTRHRYLSENFSLSELKKSLTFALANFVRNCNKKVLTSINVKRCSTSENLLFKEAYVKVLNCVLELQPSDLYTNCDSVEQFLNFHHSIQNNEGFLKSYFSKTCAIWSDWSKETWLAKLTKVENLLSENINLVEYCVKIKELRKLLNKVEEKVDDGAIPTPETPKKKLTLSEHMLMKKKLLKLARNLPPKSTLNVIFDYFEGLFDQFLVRLDSNFVASIPKNKMVLLETSNVPKLDEVMNEKLEVDTSHQLDIVTLYHALVDSNSETLQTDLTLAFEKFKACLVDTKIKECSLHARFFNALGQLEYIGAVVMGTDDSFRLVYLPSSIALNVKEEECYL